MTAASPPLVNFGWRAADFHLADTKGLIWTLNNLRGVRKSGAGVHLQPLPYVLAIVGSLRGMARRCATSGSGWRRSARTTWSPLRRTASRIWASSPASTTCRSPTFTTSTRRRPGPMARPARRTSSASIRSGSAVSRPVGRQRPRPASRRQARAPRGDAAGRPDRAGPARADAGDRLLDQMEGGVTVDVRELGPAELCPLGRLCPRPLARRAARVAAGRHQALRGPASARREPGPPAAAARSAVMPN